MDDNGEIEIDISPKLAKKNNDEIDTFENFAKNKKSSKKEIKKMKMKKQKTLKKEDDETSSENEDEESTKNKILENQTEDKSKIDLENKLETNIENNSNESGKQKIQEENIIRKNQSSTISFVFLIGLIIFLCIIIILIYYKFSQDLKREILKNKKILEELKNKEIANEKNNNHHDEMKKEIDELKKIIREKNDKIIMIDNDESKKVVVDPENIKKFVKETNFENSEVIEKFENKEENNERNFGDLFKKSEMIKPEETLKNEDTISEICEKENLNSEKLLENV